MEARRHTIEGWASKGAKLYSLSIVAVKLNQLACGAAPK